MITAIQLLGGVLMLYIGAEFLVRGAAALALRVGISALVVGLTVISFGTSAPELVVSFDAAMKYDSAIALGNVVGSNIANIALVLGLAAIIKPLHVELQVIRREAPLMLVITLLLCAMLWNGELAQWEGGLLFAAIIAYAVFSVYWSRKTGRDDDASVRSLNKQRWWLSALSVVIGLVLLLPGAHLFLMGAVTVAERMGLSTFVIGLTVVAIGTSLPEIAASVVAAFRGEGDLAIGNAIGSNVFNILFILGITALVFGIDASVISMLDFAVMVEVAAISLPIMRTGFVISRWEGALLVAGYATYIVYQLN